MSKRTSALPIVIAQQLSLVPLSRQALLEKLRPQH